jgi:hypothetical protein
MTQPKDDFMDDLDQRLEYWGEEQRANASRLSIDWTQATREVPRLGFLRGIPAAAGAAIAIVAVGVVAVGVMLSSGSKPSSEAGGKWDVVSPGDSVAASGSLVERPDGTMLICQTVDLLDLSCSDIAAPVIGVDVATVPGWEQDGGIGSAAGVTVHGTWTGTAIQASSFTAGVPGLAPPSSPCAQSDVHGAFVDPLAEPANRDALSAEVTGHPDLYGGLWVAPDEAGQMNRIVVVEVAGDPGPVTRRLQALYPNALCVTRVTLSLTDLARLHAELTASHPEWLPSIDPPSDRISVVVPVVDQATAAVLENYRGEILVTPLVRKM